MARKRNHRQSDPLAAPPVGQHQHGLPDAPLIRDFRLSNLTTEVENWGQGMEGGRGKVRAGESRARRNGKCNFQVCRNQQVLDKKLAYLAQHAHTAA